MKWGNKDTDGIIFRQKAKHGRWAALRFPDLNKIRLDSDLCIDQKKTPLYLRYKDVQQ